jgi:DNA-binding MarR family transcriptional regulator
MILDQPIIESPTSKSLKDSAAQIKSREFVYLARFADTLNRYIDMVVLRDHDNRIEWSILSIIVAKGGSATPTQLAKETYRSMHSMTRFIDSLVRKGFVVRADLAHDRRIVNISITKLGLERLMKSLTLIDKSCQPILNQLSMGERNTYVDLTKTLQKYIFKEVNNLTSENNKQIQ